MRLLEVIPGVAEELTGGLLRPRLLPSEIEDEVDGRASDGSVSEQVKNIILLLRTENLCLILNN